MVTYLNGQRQQRLVVFVNARHVVLLDALILVVGVDENGAILVPVDLLHRIAADLALERELLVHELKRLSNVELNNWRN